MSKPYLRSTKSEPQRLRPAQAASVTAPKVILTHSQGLRTTGLDGTMSSL